MKEARTSKTTNPITKLIATSIPKTLWHYTSIDAFKKIVESKQIFATEVHYLNDRSEFIHARQMADDVIAEFPARSKIDKAVAETTAVFIKDSFEFVTLNNPEVYVASFTAAEDQLSQWRAYSYGTAGVSLGFDLRGFRPKGGTAFAACFAPCIYGTEEKKLLLRSALVGLAQKLFDRASRATKGRQKLLSKSAIKRITPAFTRFLRDILRVSALSKHESFAEEKEWRLVLALVPSRSSDKFTRQFRVKPTTLAPYVTYPLSTEIPYWKNQSRLVSGVLPLTDVILGPDSDENAVYAAKMFLRERDLIMARVRVSKAPYRT